MIVSRAKTEDMRVRALMLDAIELQVRTGRTEDAKATGQASQALAQKIKTHDYSKEDLYLAWESARMAWTEGKTTDHPGTFQEYVDNKQKKPLQEV